MEKAFESVDGKQSRAACDVENKIFKLQMCVIDPVS